VIPTGAELCQRKRAYGFALPRLRNGTNRFRSDMDSTWSLTSISSMSVVSSSSLASGRNPESSYRDSSTSDRDQLTPSPPVYQDSHDEYTPRANPLTAPAGPRRLNVHIRPASLLVLVRHLIGFTNRSTGRIPCAAL
jgi:hypothetical protein